VDRLDDHQHWSLQLSPGEQQRVAFARALLQKTSLAVPRRGDFGAGRSCGRKTLSAAEGKAAGTTIISIGPGRR